MRVPNRIVPIAAAALLVLSGGPAALAGEAHVYTWTDGRGVVHYGDRRPSDVTAPVEDIDLPVAPPSAGRAADPSLNERLRRLRAERAAREEARRRACEQALALHLQQAQIAEAEVRTRRIEAAAEREARPIYVFPYGSVPLDWARPCRAWPGCRIPPAPPVPAVPPAPPTPPPANDLRSLTVPPPALGPVEVWIGR